MSPEYGYSDDPEHRAAFPGRRCAVATEACKGRVVVTWGAAQLCDAHWSTFSEADSAATVDRLREWVRVERKREAAP